MSRALRHILTFVLCTAAALLDASEPLVVIVHPDSGITQMSREEVAMIFMGSQKRLSSGLVAIPVEPMVPEESRALFYHLLVNLPLAQVRSYWAKLYFSGQAQPPRQAQSSEEVVEIVATTKGAVGFVEQSKLNHKVRGVLNLGGPGAP